MPDDRGQAPVRLHREHLLRLIAEAGAFPPQVRERLLWLLHYVETQSVSATCRRFDIARTTFYRWYDRFDPANLSTLADQSMIVPFAPEPLADDVFRRPEPAPRRDFLRRTLITASVLLNVAVISALAAMVAWEMTRETPVIEASVTATPFL